LFFIILLALSALSLAGSAAFFSIYGLAKIYSGSLIATIIMGSSIEAGKLMAASYLYRFWKKTSFFLRMYLFFGIIISMIVTSIGVYGFLTASYQADSVPLNEIETKIVLLGEKKIELKELKTELQQRRSQLTKQIDDLPSNYATKRERVRKQIKPELDKINNNLDLYTKQFEAATTELHELKTKIIQQKVHTGPIIYIAKAFGQEVDNAISWLTIIIMLVFDPLAVALTICLNIVILDRNKYKKTYTIKEEIKVTKPMDKPIEIHNEIIIPAEEKVEDLVEEELIVEEEYEEIEEVELEPEDDTISVDDVKTKLDELNNKENLTTEESHEKQDLERLLSQIIHSRNYMLRFNKKI